jgi:hypothetical protein
MFTRKPGSRMTQHKASVCLNRISTTWMYRHRLQAETKRPVDERTSQRFAREFEAAVRARGEAARVKFTQEHPHASEPR